MDRHFAKIDGPDVVITKQADPYAKPGEHAYDHGVVRVNIPRAVVFHEPEGFAVNERAPGTYDLALNILQAFLPGKEIEALEGTRGSMGAFLLHEAFAHDKLLQVPYDTPARIGGAPAQFRLNVAEIKAWIKSELHLTALHRRTFQIGHVIGYADATNVNTLDGGSMKSVFLVQKETDRMVKLGGAEGLFFSIHSEEPDMPFIHKDFEGLLGKKLKITLEEIVDDYNG